MKLQRRYLTSLIPVTASISAITFALTRQSWALWGVEAMEGRTPAPTSFADLANITLTADCLAQNASLENCDPYGRPFQPYAVFPARILHSLGLGLADTGAIGVFLAGTTVVTVILLSFIVANRWERGTISLIACQIAIGAIAVSPPVMLGVERGQLEQLTLLLVVISLLLLPRPRLAGVSGIVLSLCATVSKFFSVGMFLPFITQETLRRRLWAPLIACGLSAIALVLLWPSVQQAATASNSTVPQTTKSAFGAANMIATFFSSDPIAYQPPQVVMDNWIAVRVISLALFMVLIALGAVFLRSRLRGSVLEVPYLLVVGSTGVLTLPFILGSSHDYRLMFLLPLACGAAMMVGAPNKPGRRGARSVPIAMMCLSVVCAVSGAAMVQNILGVVTPLWLLLAGDIGLMILLALGTALWLTNIRIGVRH